MSAPVIVPCEVCGIGCSATPDCRFPGGGFAHPRPCASREFNRLGEVARAAGVERIAARSIALTYGRDAAAAWRIGWDRAAVEVVS